MLPHVGEMFEKLDIQNFVKEYRQKKESDSIVAALDLIKFIMKNSQKVKEEVFSIVAIAEDKDLEEVRIQSLATTLKTLQQIFSDKELIDFFKQAMQ